MVGVNGYIRCPKVIFNAQNISMNLKGLKTECVRVLRQRCALAGGTHIGFE